MKSRDIRKEAQCWKLPEIIFFSYLGIILLILLIPGVIFGGHSHPWPLLLLHLAFAITGYLIHRLPLLWDHPFTWFIRWWYPVIFFLACFSALGKMIHIIQNEYLDPIMTVADQTLFGTILTPWMQQAANPWITELMYFCYFSFYIFIPGVGIPLYLRCRRKGTGTAEVEFQQFLATIVLTMYFCYLHFLLTPVGGPVFFDGYPGPLLELTGGPITLIEKWLFDQGTIIGGAFPSSHVAISIVAAVFAVRFRVAPLLWVPLSVGLAVSTVYNGYHYGVDVIYGLLVAAVMVVVAPALLRRFGF